MSSRSTVTGPVASGSDLPRRPGVPVLSFLGGAGTVTGSRFLVDTPRARVLVDAGLFQGRKELRLRNRAAFGVPLESLDAVVVTHAHVDHVGYLPVLVRDGFAGAVHATTGTADLARIVLPDSGHLQEEEAEYANRAGFSKHHPAMPLYTESDARTSLRSLTPTPFYEEVEVAPGVHVTFRPAGHILGSSVITMRLADCDDRTVVFSGDLGRPSHPLLVPPARPGSADVLVVESTYGDRIHDDSGALDRFAEVLRDTIGRGGTVLIPAFAVDRTEVVLMHLRDLVRSGLVPEVPVFVDSPMALRSLGVYRRAIAEGAADVRPFDLSEGDPFDPGSLTEVPEVSGSKALSGLTVPAVIVSASGMATGGRVVHHLSRLLPDHRNAVLLVGFQAPGTRGRLLADGAREVKMLGRYVPVRAEVVHLGSFSVHADAVELDAWVASADRPPETVHLVHGEPEAAEGLRVRLDARGERAVVARLGERIRLD